MEKLPKEFTSWLPAGLLLSLSTFIVCVPAAFTQVISFNLMFDLNAFPSLLYTWTFPAFIGGECSSMALCACMIDRYGRKKPYLIGALLFLFGTAGCALSSDMVPFIIMRGVQGFGAGFIIITCIAQIFFDIKTPKLRYAANGIMSLGFGVGMLTGIFAGKLAVETIGWVNAFWIIFLAQAVVAYPCYRLLSKGENSTMKADFPGAIILSIWVLILVIFLQKLMNDWTVTDPAALGGIALIITILVVFFVAEVVNPHSVFHRKVHKGNLMAASMIIIVVFGVIDMAAVGCMVKIALFTYGMSVLEAAPYFIVLVIGAATTAIALSKTIDRTGHLPWLLLSGVLSPIALLSMLLVEYDDPSYMFAIHLFLLGLAIGCLVSMLNATIQNRTNRDNNGSYISFAIMYRTAALWLGYNFYTYITNMYMSSKIGDTVAYWNSVLPIELPDNSNIANFLVTPIRYVLDLLPGLNLDIQTIFADGAAVALIAGAAIFTVIVIPVSIFMVGREKIV